MFQLIGQKEEIVLVRLDLYVTKINIDIYIYLYTYMETYMEKILICIFHCEERTLELNKYCWNKLGFKNIKVFSSKSKFHEKLIEMSNFMADKLDKYRLIIKSDADEFVFTGIFDLIEKSILYNCDLCHGYFFDKFMNKWRGSGPKVYNSLVFRAILSGKLVIKDVNKPETQLNKDMRVLKMNFKCFPIKTCLHEYEQYPSKILNTLINRYHRGHIKLYNMRNISCYDEFKCIKGYFLNYIKKVDIYSKKDCHYMDYTKYDVSYSEIENDTLESLYRKYYLLYNEKIKIRIE